MNRYAKSYSGSQHDVTEPPKDVEASRRRWQRPLVGLPPAARVAFQPYPHEQDHE